MTGRQRKLSSRHFLCRALSESKSKTQLEVSANDTCALNENKQDAKYEFSAAGTCRALSESKSKMQLKVSVNDTFWYYI